MKDKIQILYCESKYIVVPLVAFCGAFLLFFLRRPDILLNPQFWAEDGMIWFQQALDYGPIRSLFLSHTGYFQTASRLVMGGATLLPLEYAPLFSNIVALVIRSIPVAFLFTQRMSWIPAHARLLIAAYYILMPNLWEVHANISNSFWYLSLYLFMTVIANSPKTFVWRVHDVLVLLLAGLSSIGVIFIFPCYLMKLWTQSAGAQNEIAYNLTTRIKMVKDVIRQFLKPYSLLYLLVCLIQGWAVLTSAMTARSPAPLGLSDTVVSGILSARVFLGAVLPLEYVRGVWDQDFVNYTIVVFSMCVIVHIIRKHDYRLTGLVLFAGLMLIACLAKPMISSDSPQLPHLREPLAGGRYFVVPCIAWFCIIVKLISDLRKNLKIPTFIILWAIVLATGIQSFKIPPMPDLKFREYVERFEKLPAGEKMSIPINPGGNWKIDVKKK